MDAESRLSSYRLAAQDEHPDPTFITDPTPEPSSRFGVPVPAWPAGMIEPNQTELAR